MGNLQKIPQGLAKNISEDLLKISPSELEFKVSAEIEKVRHSAQTFDEYETKLVVISQQRALALEDIETEWIERCKTPKNTKKELKDITTMEQALDTLAPTLYKIRKIKGEEYVLSYIEMWLVDLQMNLNIKNKMNEAMLGEASDTILTLYGYLTIPDLKNVVTDALRGVYGEFYESISIPKLITWFEDYSQRRISECEARSISKHHYVKRSVSGFSYPEDEKRKRTKPKMITRDMLLTEKEIKEINKAKENGRTVSKD